MLFTLSLVLSALAADDGAVFNGFTHTGDGHTPSMMDALQQQQPALRQGRRMGDEDGRGGWGWSTAVAMPDALLPATVALSYASGGGPGLLGDGWSVDIGPTISRVSAAEEARLYGLGLPADLDNNGSISAWEDAAGHAYRVSGIGSGGTLVPDGTGEFMFISDEPGLTTATLHPSLVFEVRSNGTRALLEPRLQAMTAPGARARAWRPLITHDVSCNVVRVVWDARDRPQELRAGGNTQGGLLCGMDIDETTSLTTVRGWALTVPDNYTYTGRAQFTYEDIANPAAHVTSWADGAEEVFDSRLMAIDVDSRRIVGSWSPFGSLEIGYAAGNPRPVVADIIRVGADAITTQPVATFSYSEWSVDPADFIPLVVGDTGAVSELSAMWSVGSITERVAWTDDNPDGGDVFEGASTSRTMSRGSLQDWNGDGYADILTTRAPGDAVSSYGQWLGGTNEVGWATPANVPFTPTVRDFDFSDDLARYHDVHQDNDGFIADEGLEMRETVDVSDTLSATFARRVLVDLNGDGRLDLVQTDTLPPEPDYDIVNPPMSPGVLLPLLPGALHDWEVYYGRSDGTLEAMAAIVQAPVAWPGVTLSSTSCNTPTTALPGQQLDDELATNNPYNPHLVDLIDVNGDGLLDILIWMSNADWALQEQSTADLRLYLAYPLDASGAHQGFYVADFDAPTDALSLLNGSRWFERQMSASWWTDFVDDYQGDGGTADLFPQCLFTDVRQNRDLRDINRDGFPDFVVATALGWDVYPGTGHGLAEAIAWVMPSDRPMGPDGLSPISWTKESTWRPYPDVSIDFESVEPLENVDAQGAMVGRGQGQICPTPPPLVNMTPFYYTENLSRHILGMVDVDQDGLDDLVLSKHVPCDEMVPPEDTFQWWRNTGGGFADAGECGWDAVNGFDCPEWGWLAE